VQFNTEKTDRSFIKNDEQKLAIVIEEEDVKAFGSTMP
jgi:hypothetical protein